MASEKSINAIVQIKNHLKGLQTFLLRIQFIRVKAGVSIHYKYSKEIWNEAILTVKKIHRKVESIFGRAISTIPDESQIC